jgi:F-type H+-transporting ATPase subunit epsilon
MALIHLNIVTPEKSIASEEVDEVTLPGIQGEFGVLPQHTTFLTLLKEGSVSYRKGNQTERLQIAGGACEVYQASVTVLVDRVVVS